MPRFGARGRMLLFSGTGLVAALAPSAMGADASVWIEVAGRTHPMLVHFPIALLAAACVFEIVRIASGRDKASPAGFGCLVLAVLGAGGAGVTGWVLAGVEGRAGEAEIEVHRWVAVGGASVALLAVVLALSARLSARQTLRRLYVLSLLGGAMTVGVAGHFGGELVYGRGYVLAPLRARTAPATDAAPVPVAGVSAPGAAHVSFERDVLPIFVRECTECHGVKEQKGQLRLDSAAALRGNPYLDEIVVAGDASKSVLFEVITLPETHRDFMPKKGKPLSAWQIETIRRWIESGVRFDDGGEMAMEPTATEPIASTPQPSQVDVEALGVVIAAVRDRGGHASLVASDVPELVVNYSIVEGPLSDQDIALLAPVGERVVELNVGGVEVGDSVVAQVARLSGLRRLNLSRSQISDAAIEQLSGLTRLEVLNVYGCPIGAASIEAIAGMSTLRRVYVWQTGMDHAAVARLRELRPEMEVIAGDEEGAEPGAGGG
ncbi:MAG: hypothetical protein KJZ65_10670 [Phycisphaerales bacterium]|nr:hypothetical protein [Phycisphaerales bacterium]